MGYNTLEHLIEIEAEAAALVNDARQEADRRVHDNEEKKRAAYNEQYKAEIQMQQTALEKEKDQVKKQYQSALDDYRREISGTNIDEKRFSELLNNYITNNYLTAKAAGKTNAQ